MRKRGLTRPRRAVKPAPVPHPPSFVLRPTARPEQRRKKTMSAHTPQECGRHCGLPRSAERRQIFSAVSCYFAIPAKLRDLRREGRCYFLVSSLFAADLRQSKKKEARNCCGFGLLEKAIYLLENWGARRAAFRPYCASFELFFLDIPGFSGFLLLGYPVCGP